MPDTVLLIVGSIVPLLAVGLAFAAESARPTEPPDREPWPGALPGRSCGDAAAGDPL